ncbi:MAG: hypothetical protein LBR48_04455 [Dysgonamonadaceae bacterium]|jgi:hypothetical protein|nr:hypothetical protein [Dysgonamonadaceae bacterium]
MFSCPLEELRTLNQIFRAPKWALYCGKQEKEAESLQEVAEWISDAQKF